jgi:hypothetical protein
VLFVKYLSNTLTMVRYRSTRGSVSGVSFEEVVLGGLAPDRGLYVPDSIPTFTPSEVMINLLCSCWPCWITHTPSVNRPASPLKQIESMRDFSFEQLALAVMSKYISTDEVCYSIP